MTIALTINGKTASAEADPQTPLLWVIREHLKLTGTKYGCGSGLCGACTVHIDGKAVASCQTAASQAVGKQITTIEGLSPDNSHPLQKATRSRRASRSSAIWMATSAAAAPIPASYARSSARHGRPEP